MLSRYVVGRCQADSLRSVLEGTKLSGNQKLVTCGPKMCFLQLTDLFYLMVAKS